MKLHQRVKQSDGSVFFECKKNWAHTRTNARYAIDVIFIVTYTLSHIHFIEWNSNKWFLPIKMDIKNEQYLCRQIKTLPFEIHEWFYYGLWVQTNIVIFFLLGVPIMLLDYF